MVPLVRLSENATIPIRSSLCSAGYDVFASCNGIIPSHQRLVVPLDISIQLPAGYYAHLLPRSGLAVRSGIHIGAGVIDEDYRGNIGVVMMNLSDKEYTFQKGDRIAQMVIKRYEVVTFTEQALESSQRGTSGFGSTGL